MKKRGLGIIVCILKIFGIMLASVSLLLIILMLIFIHTAETNPEWLFGYGGRDTVLLIGDGRYQILNNGSLLNSKDYTHLNDGVERYLQIDKVYYIQGKYYTIVETENYEIQTYENYDDLPQEYKRVFDEEEFIILAKK